MSGADRQSVSPGRPMGDGSPSPSTRSAARVPTSASTSLISKPDETARSRQVLPAVLAGPACARLRRQDGEEARLLADGPARLVGGRHAARVSVHVAHGSPGAPLHRGSPSQRIRPSGSAHPGCCLLAVVVAGRPTNRLRNRGSPERPLGALPPSVPTVAGRRLLLSEGTAPAWSPDGRRIAYQTRCGIRFVTPAGLDVTPTAGRNACGAIGV